MSRRPVRPLVTRTVAALTATLLTWSLPATTAGAATTGNACSNPVLATDLAGWGSLDAGEVSRDTVGDLGAVRYAFATTGHEFYQPELRGIVAGQQWTLTTRDRLLGGSGTATLIAQFYDVGGRYLSEVAGPRTGLSASTRTGGAWTAVTATVTVPAGAVNAHVVQRGGFGIGVSAFKATDATYLRASTGPSGVAMPVGDLAADATASRGWQQVFADDFTVAGPATEDGNLPDGRWRGYRAGTKITNSTNGVYDSSRTVAVGDGSLRFHLHSERGTAYAAVESPDIAGSQTYGRYDVRYRYASGSTQPGFKSVWMTWPDDDRWNEGEIDFHEYGNTADRTGVEANFHQRCGASPCDQDQFRTAVDPTAWHTATAIWSPGKVSSFLDGRLIGTSTTNVPITPMHMLLQTEASDYGPTAEPAAVVDIDVDWVSVYRRV